MPLVIQNPTIRNVNQTSLSQAVQAGGTEIPVYSTSNITAPSTLIIDNLGVQSAEIVRVLLVSGSNTIYLDHPLLQSHPQSATVASVDADTIQVWRSTSGAVGPYQMITTVSGANYTIPVDPTSIETSYFDLLGQSTYTYYAVLYNTLTNWTSGQSSVIGSGGFAPNSLGDLKQRVRNLVKDEFKEFVSDQELTTYINEKYQKMQQAATIINKNYRTINEQYIYTNLNQQEYPLPPDFWEVKYVRTALNPSVAGNNPPGTNFYTAMPAKMETIFNIQYGYYPYMANNGYNFNMLAMPGIFEFYYLNGQKIGFYPFFQGAYWLLYYPTSVYLINDTDVPFTPLNDFGYMIVNYAFFRVYQKSGRADLTRVEMMRKQLDADDSALISYLQEREVQFNPSVETTDTRYLDALNNDIFQEYF
jgi:hypothetical protein